MPALARASDDDCYSRAANDACINGGPWTRTKYAYVGGSPIAFTDPTGLLKFSTSLGASTVVRTLPDCGSDHPPSRLKLSESLTIPKLPPRYIGLAAGYGAAAGAGLGGAYGYQSGAAAAAAEGEEGALAIDAAINTMVGDSVVGAALGTGIAVVGAAIYSGAAE